ncbi:MAG TPA: SagB/ThcOx family dehydrogenase, partial [Blastocatellia bacterium]|nr:SagB/ThcOx family dehydrogenase [Blastocatellia bacterium]
MNRDTSHARNYHRLTSHSYLSVRSTAHHLDWANMPSPFKVYPHIDPIPLPRDLLRTGKPALECLSASFTSQETSITPSLDQLAAILYFSAGVTRTKTYPGGQIYFRAAACAGALYPIETYVVCSKIEGLEAGVYHFSPGDFALRLLRKGDHRQSLVEATAGDERISRAPIVLVYTAISWRSTWKYRDRAYRYHFWDNGMVLANALAMASAQALPARLVMGFIDEKVNNLVGADGQRELSLSLLTLGTTSDRAAPAEADLKPLNPEVIPLSHSQRDYHSIIEMNRASSLTDEGEVAAWRDSRAKGLDDHSTREEHGSNIPLQPLETERQPEEAIEDVIQRRASTR